VRGTPGLWISSVLTLFFFAYAAKVYYPGKQPMQAAAQAVSIAKLAQAKAESRDTETKAATPEDPGDATLVGPLAVWMREANPAPQSEPARVWSGPLQPMDHASSAAPLADKYLRANFPLQKSAQFTFVIPPHTVSPRLHGNFRSSIRHAGSDVKAAEVELMLLNAQQYDDFIHGRAADAAFELESSNHTVDFLLPPSHNQPEEYHLVFRDHAIRTNLFVKADFAVNAE
jgi:hypothetical protein